MPTREKKDAADPLNAGFYSISDVARLLGEKNKRKIHGWLNGWNGSNAAPIISRDFKETKTISFLDLMEIRFVEYFRSNGVSMQTLRRAAEKARTDWKTDHPFALSKVRYLTDRRKIFAQAAKENGDTATWDLASGQHEIWEAIERVIEKNVQFDPRTQLAQSWIPRPEYSNVIVDPRIAFGHPALCKSGIPTGVLFRQWKIEQSKEKIAEWFEIDKQSVEEAIEFEIAMAA